MNIPGHHHHHHHHHITMSMSKLLKLWNTQYRKKETNKQLNCNIYPLAPPIPDLVHAEMAAN